MSAEGGDWLEIAVEVAGIDAETVADIFRQGCEGGAVIQPSSRLDPNTDTYIVDGDGRAVVKGYIRPDADTARVERSLRLAVQSAPLTAEPSWLDAAVLKEADWRDAWKAHFGLQRIGESIVIRPSWITYRLKEGEVAVDIDPGMAFGTGQHPTTAMCLRALERLVRDGSSVLDLGCGSGILAIAAVKLGASRAVAVDIDPQAAKAARANVEANGVAAAVELREGTLGEEGAGERFDIVAANISGLALERLAPAIQKSLTPGGRLVASGFLDDYVESLRAAFEEAGLTVERIVEEGVWRSIVATRSDA